MTDPRTIFFASLVSTDRHFREDFDLQAARALQGADRVDALDALTKLLDEGLDPRVPRALAAMNATERQTDLRVALTLGQPRVRAESAIAYATLGGDPARAEATLRGVLTDPGATTEGKVRAIIGLERLDTAGAMEALIDAIVDDDVRNVRGNAFDGAMRKVGLHGKRTRNSRLDALYQLMTSDLPGVRKAHEGDLRQVLADALTDGAAAWLDPVDTADPAFEALRKRLMEAHPVGSAQPLTPQDVQSLDAAALLLLQAWSVHLLDRGHGAAPAAARALGVRGV